MVRGIACGMALSMGEELARVSDAPLLGQIPIDPELARLCDAGDIESYDGDIMKDLSEAIHKVISTKGS